MTTFSPAIFSTTCSHPYAMSRLPVHRWHGSHSHVPPASAAHQLPGVESNHKTWLGKWRITINIPKNSALIFPTSSAFSGANPLRWCHPLSWGDPIHGWFWPLISIRLERKWQREWECWNLSWTRGVVSTTHPAIQLVGMSFSQGI